MKKNLLSIFLSALLFVLFTNTAQSQIVYNMCSSGTTFTTTDSTGTLYDSGGPGGVYLDYEDCQLLIAPSCAVSITLTFSAFNTEACCDPMTIYDGQTTAAPIVLTNLGTTIPPPVTCTSGYMLIVWHSDLSITYDGYAATWHSVIASSAPPTAAFNLSATNPPLNAGVHFTDVSVGSPTAWVWDFGDGGNSNLQNPTHAYTTPGTFTVTLIAYSCTESDTITHTVTVQAAPSGIEYADTLQATINCGDSAVFHIVVKNTGGGDLVYSAGGSVNSAVHMLSEVYGTDITFYYQRTIDAINTQFTNYTNDTTSTTDPATLATLLIGKNVLLFPRNSLGQNSVFAGFASVLQTFLINGGTIIFCGTDIGLENVLASGLFNGTWNGNLSGFFVDVVNTTDSIMSGITAAFTAPTTTFSMSFTNGDKVQLVSYLGNDIVSYRKVGGGKVIYEGFDNFNGTIESQKIIANAVKFAGTSTLPPWVTLSPPTDTLAAGDSTIITVVFHANGIPAAVYNGVIPVATNDPNNPVFPVFVSMNVIGFPIIGMSDACATYGTIINNTTLNDTVSIINNGCDSLLVSSIVSSLPQYTVTPATGVILPGDSMPIIITFAPTAVGTYNGTLTIHNNDNDTTICLTGISGPAPVITTASTVSQTVPACGNTGTTTFTIQNTGVAGAADLTYSISGLPTWLQLSGTSGIVSVGQTVTITCTFNSGTYSGGPQSANIIIATNDPLNTTVIVAVTMNVGLNPCFDFAGTTSTCTGIGTFTTNNIINTPTTWSWDFGDGGTSTAQNPQHQYALPGTYVVTAIGTNAAGSDTATHTVILTVITGPTAAACIPATAAYCCGIGITHVVLGDINKSSGDAFGGYQNYTCTDTTTLLTCTSYPISVTTGTVYEEGVKAWLDYDNNGAFDPSELIFGDSAVITTHTGTVNVHCPSPVLNTPLRLRIGSDYSGNPLPDGCTNLQYGQYEDYVVFLSFSDGVGNLSASVPFSVYPNPFTNKTTIDYTLGSNSKVSVEVYNVIGEVVTAFAKDELQNTGRHSYIFDNAISGVYFIKLKVGDNSSVQKVVKMQ